MTALDTLATAAVRYALTRRNHLEPAATLDALTELWPDLSDGAQDVVWRDVAREWCRANCEPHQDLQFVISLSRWLRRHDFLDAARRWLSVSQAALNDVQQRDLTRLLGKAQR